MAKAHNVTHPLLLFGVLSEVELAALGWYSAVFPKKSHSGTLKLKKWVVQNKLIWGNFLAFGNQKKLSKNNTNFARFQVFFSFNYL
jgi:hypothetical protein